MTLGARGLARMIDANANRAREGLRVVEDVLRFVRVDAALSGEARRLRHVVTAAVTALGPARTLLAARDARSDPGRARWRGGTRQDAGALLRANFRRAQEAVRVLEEGARLALKAGPARRLQAIRYRLYALESRAGVRSHR